MTRLLDAGRDPWGGLSVRLLATLAITLVVSSCGPTAASPPGRALVYQTSAQPPEQPAELVLARPDGRRQVLARGPEDADLPRTRPRCSLAEHPAAWSPDGRRLLYGSPSSGLRVVSLDAPQECTSLPRTQVSTRAVWSPDGGRLAFARDRGPEIPRSAIGIHLVGRDGREVRQLTDPPRGVMDGTPSWAPSGERIAFIRRRHGSGESSSTIHVISPEGRTVAVLARGTPPPVGRPEWSASGRLLAVAGGEGVRVISVDGDLDRHYPLGGHVDRLTWSPTGRRLAVMAGRDLYLLRPGRSEPRRIAGLASTEAVSWSPGGDRLAAASGRPLRGGQGGVHIVDAATGQVARVAAPRDEASLGLRAGHVGQVDGVWSPDGSHLVFEATSREEGLIVTDRVTDVFTVRADGSDLRQITTNGESHSPAFRPLPR